MSWVDELHLKYKHLFELYEDEDTPYYKKGDILRGIECSDAWQRIVTQFMETMEWHRTHNTYVPNPNYIVDEHFELKDNPQYIDGGPNMVQIFQIKEKFGSFRASVKCSDNIRHGIEHAIGYAEGQANLTCYSCGKVGEFPKSDRGWIMRICPECEANRKGEPE